MTTYAFETITPEQALAISDTDFLTFAGGPASRVSVHYQPDLARISVTFDGRTVVFGDQVAGLSLRGALDMGDGSRLIIGNDSRQLVGGFGGSDALFGGGGADTLHGGQGDDLLQGNAGDDRLFGDGGSNTIYGGQGDDYISVAEDGETRGSWAHGNKGDDTVVGANGNDTLYGGQGNDSVAGGFGDDLLFGDLGDDTIATGGGHDTVQGGDGRDLIIVSGEGRSVLFGGAGADRFEIISTGRMPARDQICEIRDWEHGDTLRFAQVGIFHQGAGGFTPIQAPSYEWALDQANAHFKSGARVVAAQVGNDVFVFAETDDDVADGADAAVLLVGRTLADIDASNIAA
jgi:Ca2+-binding RTX toxin-like protein